MKHPAVALAFACGVAAVLGPSPARAQLPAPPPEATTPLAFTNVTVVDVSAGRLVPKQTVVVEGNRIKAVGGDIRAPKGATVVDATGKYMIPGLWDMHVHVWGYADVAYPLLIANGVTGIREMNTPYFDSLLQWRREIVAGTRVGPRIVGTAASLGIEPEGAIRLFSGPDPQIGVTTPDEARRVVDSLRTAGVDFIKTRNGLSRPVYFAIAAEARRLGIPLAGHLSDSVTALEASDSGQHSIEHGFFRSCAADTGTDEQCAALAAHLIQNDTWATPTIITMRYVFGGVAPERLQYWPDTLEAGKKLFMQGDMLREGWEASVARYRRAGMPLLAGTDASPAMPENTPGLSLHEELALFVQGGLTPLEALQTATLNPAKYLHGTDSLGTITAGKLADLVLLDADPLEDIGNAAKIYAVVANGRYFDRAALETLVTDVKRKAVTGVKPTP